MRDTPKIRQLIEQVEAAFAAGKEYAYVEVGRYKGYGTGTVRALRHRGYRIERRVLGGAYLIYPKPAVLAIEETYSLTLTESEIIAIRELIRRFPSDNDFAKICAPELCSLEYKTAEKLAAISNDKKGLKSI